MDVDLMHGRCSVMYENTNFHFSFPVKGSLLSIFLPGLIRYCESFGGRGIRHDWFPEHRPQGPPPLFILPQREQQTWQLCFVELAHLSLSLVRPVTPGGQPVIL